MLQIVWAQQPLQWVHSLVAVVILQADGGVDVAKKRLQWVHSLVAVVIQPLVEFVLGDTSGFNGSTVW